MSKSWSSVRLGEVLKPRVERMAIDPVAPYKEVTVRLWGKGVIERGTATGAAIAATGRYKVKFRDFVLSKIDARNGALGIVPKSLDGALVSGDFPVFEANQSRMLPEYIGWLCKTAGFVESCRQASEGTTNRVRLKLDRFLSSEIPLPPLDEQKRIVAYLDTLSTKITQARTLRHQSTDESEALTARVARHVFPEPNGGKVGDWVRFQTGYAFKSEWFCDDGVRLARNANIGHGTLDWSETARIPASRRNEFSRFELQEGDILVALDRPIISTGVKVARVRKSDLPLLLLQRVARAHFGNGNMAPDYFFRWLQSPHFTGAIDPGRSNGVPHISHKDIENIPIAVPSLNEQRRIVAELDALQAKVDALKQLQADTDAELTALQSAALDRAFKGEL